MARKMLREEVWNQTVVNPNCKGEGARGVCFVLKDTRKMFKNPICMLKGTY